MNDDEYVAAIQATWGEQLVAPKFLGEHGVVGLYRFMFTWAIITDVGPCGYEDRWCYHNYERAKAAYDDWDGNGEPSNWHRHPDSGRRVNKDGTMEVYR